MSEEVTLIVEGLWKSFQGKNGGLLVLEDISLQVPRGEFLSIVGPSGCGKSTLLRIIAGLEKPSKGEVLLDGKRIEGPGSDRGMVFQDFTSFPWLTVTENIRFGLSLKKDIKEELGRRRVYELLKYTDLIEFADFYPSDLSGGMKQRVALARTLATSPKLVLMDEPFGALDAQSRSEMQLMLLQLRKKTKMTGLFVTHDVGEAIFLGDRVAVLSTRPARLQNMIEVPFQRPRSTDLFSSQSFLSLESEILRELRSIE